jgi:uncharacterized protein (TIGR02265 family)
VPDFRAPKFGPIDLEEHIAAIPEGAMAKGLGVWDALRGLKGRELEVFRRAGVHRDRYLPFADYRYPEILRMLDAAAQILHPKVPNGEALRRLGWRAFDAFFGTQAGRAIFGFFELGPETLFRMAPAAYNATLGFGRIDVEKQGDRLYHVHFRDRPILIETYQVGVVEGAFRHVGHEARTRIALEDLANATVEVTW